MRAEQRLSSESQFSPRILTQEFLRSNAAHKKVDGAAHAVCEFVWTGEIDGPLAHDRAVEAFHEFGEMHDGERACHFAALLALGENFAEQADGSFFVIAQFGGANWIHCARQN